MYILMYIVNRRVNTKQKKATIEHYVRGLYAIRMRLYLQCVERHKNVYIVES